MGGGVLKRMVGSLSWFLVLWISEVRTCPILLTSTRGATPPTPPVCFGGVGVYGAFRFDAQRESRRLEVAPSFFRGTTSVLGWVGSERLGQERFDVWVYLWLLIHQTQSMAQCLVTCFD